MAGLEQIVTFVSNCLVAFMAPAEVHHMNAIVMKAGLELFVINPFAPKAATLPTPIA